MEEVFVWLVNCLLVQSQNVYKMEETNRHFAEFKAKHNKQYDTVIEEEMRYLVFKQNLREINELNKAGDAVYGITEFTDLTKEEFLRHRTGLKGGLRDVNCEITLSLSDAPDAFDWRSKNVVSRVKDQGRCGSCWAFGASGAVESQYAIMKNKTQEVSEQQLVDCDTRSSGCDGTAYLSNPFIYFIKNGAMSEEDYPYKARDGKCKYDGSKVRVRVQGCRSLNLNGDEVKLKKFLYEHGPATIAVDATALSYYESGIINKSQCNSKIINHAVLLVGYGTENGIPFWIIKNSWGNKWGEQGYFRVQRGVNCLLLAIENPIQPIINHNVYKMEEADRHFAEFKAKHNKQYDTVIEEELRFLVFKQNLKEINEMNKGGDAVYGITEFSDLTKDEFLRYHTGLKGELRDVNCEIALTLSDAPDAFDWRTKNVVSRVKNQGRCGSCWAFGASGAVESQYAIVKNKTQEVSEQQLVDCDTRSSGCDGTNRLANPFIYFIENGAMSEEDYPYEAKNGQCQYDKGKIRVAIQGCRSLKLDNDEEKLKKFLYEHGPATIGVDGTALNWYKSGIVSDSQCTSDIVNHAVLLVGYGTENGIPFWIIKNSWGGKWGEEGYFRMQRGINCLSVTKVSPIQPIIN
ncbi:uncharacterized protein LOC119828856 [Zerene cesonia]|uniref:uncharacterized protein LOC119828856 n=1 Tax=Zerene cesonia TaxID=33412 RepID=UPI0018E58686|nr:uncharacterized protein LOC119828856 [Zerene cesonia]